MSVVVIRLEGVLAEAAAARVFAIFQSVSGE